MLASLSVFFLFLYAPLTLGVLMRRWRPAAPQIMRWTILTVEPWLFLYSLWTLDPGRLQTYVWVPVIAAILVLVPLLTLPAAARRLLPDPGSRGSFVLVSAFSNIGTTGGAFLCYLIFGMPGLSLAYLFLLPYPFLVFTLGFGLARRWGLGEATSGLQALRALCTDPVSALPLLAMGTGAVLTAAGIRPPTAVIPWVDVLIKLDIALMGFAIGTTLDWPDWSRHWRALAAAGAIKFAALPLLAAMMVLAIYGSWEPLPPRIVLVQSFMPAAIYAVVTSNLFKLDRPLANTLWIGTTLALALAPVALLLFALLR